jgi:nitrite reductase (NO-forming)
MLKFSTSFILLTILLLFATKETNAQTAPAESIKKGQTVYSTYCIACHQETGKGMEGAFPPLAGSDFLKADHKRAITTVMKGLQGEITVNGKKYNGVMPDFGLNDEQIADVLNYVNNSWGNKGKTTTVAEVKAARAAKK